MSIVLLLIFSIVSIGTKSQDVIEQSNANGAPLVDGKVCYSDVVNYNGADVKSKFLKAREWALKVFDTNTLQVILDDKENFFFAVRGELMEFKDPLISNGKIESVMKLTFKDGRYKYEFTDLKVKYTLSVDGKDRQMPLEDWINNTHWKSLFSDLSQNTSALISDLNQYLLKQDW